MTKEDLKKLLKGIKDIHPVILANIGVLLLCLPLVVPIADKNVDNAMFVAALALITYGGIHAITADIKSRKSNKSIEREVKEEIAKRKKQIMSTMGNQK